MGALVIGVDLAEKRRRHAKSMGANITLDSGADDPVEQVWQLTSGRGAECGLDASDNARARGQMVRLLGT